MSRRRKLNLSLEPKTRRGIAVVFLFALAALLLLGIFDMAGALGHALDEGVSHVFGWDKILLPFIFIAWGYYLLAPQRLPLRFSNAFGFILLFLTLNPLVHCLTFPASATTFDDSVISTAGGKLGEVIAVPLIRMMGYAGTVTVTIAVFIISLLLIFNATLEEVLFFIKWAFKAVWWLLKQLVKPIKNFFDKRQKEPVVETPLETFQPTQLKEIGPTQASNKNQEGEDDYEIVEEAPAKPRKHYPRIEIPMDLLERRDQRPTSGDITHNREMIRKTLENFGIPVEMAEVSVGPTVTQFSLKPAEGIKLTRITSLHNDLAMALAAHPIRIEAPIPGKSLVGIEVPNQSVATVGLREVLESKEFQTRKSNLYFGLGKDVAGKPWVADLGRMPHLLVAGATGSGKSVCLNTLIVSYLYTNGPDDLKFIMVDPKRVELQIYNGIPHLVTPVITKVNETVNALKWALREMDKRYDLLSKFGSRDLASYNARVQDKLPYLVIIVDELADLMAMAANEVEGPIVRLAQMARAVGIHLVLATQRPSVDVITGLIKANIPARIAFAVASAVDSRTILDQQGAEKLLGRGDMLFSTAELSQPKRLQGTYVGENEISRLVDFIKSKYDPADYDLSVTERQSGTTVMGGGGSLDDEDSDPLLPEAKEEILRAGKASASLLQRRLKVGYARAARILDLLEGEGFIGPGDGAKPREILKADFTKASEIPSPEPPPAEPPAEPPTE